MGNGYRAWCFTLNNPSDEDTASLPTQASSKWPHVHQCVYQLESGANGTPHYQGYVRFTLQKTLNVVRGYLPRAHWAQARGNAQQNYEYCTKEEGRLGEPVVVGEFGGRAGNDGERGAHLKRGELVTVVQNNPNISVDEIIDLGGLDVLANNPNILGVLRGYLCADDRTSGVTVELFHGPSGTGKSRLAAHEYPSAYRKAAGDWWCHYQGEPTVILDDFDSDFMPIGQFLRVCDRYNTYVQVKGGNVKLVATKFIITSNLLPHEWYPREPPSRIYAVTRRIDYVYSFSTTGVRKHNGQDFFNPHVNSAGTPFVLPWDERHQQEEHAERRVDGVEPTLPLASSPDLFELDDYTQPQNDLDLY